MSDDILSPESISQLAAALVRCPSVNPSLVPDEPGGEVAVAALASEWLNRHGVRAWIEESAPGRPNVVAEVTGEPGPTLVLCAHLDTVGVAGMPRAFDPELRDGKLFGRGSYDMKGSAAAVMCAAAALARQPLRGRVLVALVADEEYASLGAQDFVRRHAADGCILTEASANELVLAHKGFLWAEVTTHGRAAHGSRWDLGESAIGRMGPIITAIEAFDRAALRERTHPLVGPASMHCATVRGGSGLSTYADDCRLQVERRTLPGEHPGVVLEELRSLVRLLDGEADVRLLLDRPPLCCDPGAPIACCVRDAATTVAGSAPRETGVAYWMDAALFAGAGIPTVNYGPHGSGAHEAVEWVDVDSLVVLARVLTESARGFHRYGPARQGQ